MNAQNLRQSQRSLGATSMAAAYLLAAVFSAGLLSACDNKSSKEAEDVARIRALMEKQEAEKKEQEAKSKARMAEFLKNAQESSKKQGY